jgi:single-strand selective monofunctional uracil DNA glycosylase
VVSALVRISRDLSREVSGLSFGPPVEWVYNPLEYARAPHEAYLARYGAPPREVVFLGMNPGPFGMAQTGVPFGDVAMVRDWLGIRAPVSKPDREHPKRPVLGFDCPRSEVSGTRIWGWARERFGTPDRFFDRFFIANYCPLVFMEAGGRNVTPDKLRAEERRALGAACDRALERTVDVLDPELIVGVGKFAEARARDAIGPTRRRIGCILHPSPASPLANRGWAPAVEAQLRELGIQL